MVSSGEEEMLCRIINLLAAAAGFAYATAFLATEVVESLAFNVA